mgnify:CR=1 FL=1
MSKHYTCDKCGYPMENNNTLTIGYKEFDICTSCQSEIMKGLDGKGNPSSASQYKAIDEFKKRMDEQTGKYPI